jgi:hypothetical protein
MPLPGAPANVAINPGPAPRTATVQWDSDPDATSAEVLVSPGLTAYDVNTPAAPAGTRRSTTLTNLDSGTTYQVQVQNISAEGKGPAVTQPLVTPPNIASTWWLPASWIFLLLILGAAAVCGAGALFWYHGQGQRIAWYSSALALLILFLGLLLPALTGGQFGVWSVVIGTDKRISTSKTQMFLWTLLVAYILVYFTSRTWFGGVQHLFDGFVPGGDNAGTNSAWPDYLVLLGGPFAAAVISKAAVSTKVANGTIQKAQADDGDTTPAQVVTDDTGQPDLVDTQYFLFNLAALTYVIVALAESNALPQIPGLLLALTSASAATYAANKTVGQNKPAINGLTPMTVQPGQLLTVDGANFMPAGTTANPTVAIGNMPAMVKSGASDGQIQAIVPAGAQSGTTSVVVTTSAGIASDPQTLTVGSDTPVIRALSPALASPGQPLTIQGSGFYSALDGATTATVLFTNPAGPALPPDNQTFDHLADGIDRLTTHVPQGALPNTNIGIVVLTNRGAQTQSSNYHTG